jgi:circadian clock protein KaiC
MRLTRTTDKRSKATPVAGLDKAATGIKGFDELSGGGLPRGRTSIVCGGPGCGKTLFGLEFLVRGVEQFGEPGVLLAFEEPPEEMARNIASLGLDLQGLSQKKKLHLDHVRLDANEVYESGAYDLEGLFIRLQNAVDEVGAKRVVLDTLEALFSGFSNLAILRAEIRRLFQWLRDRGLTTVVTAERGNENLTRHGLEEYVSDCVILLDHRIKEQISTRRLRIVKYRGTQHGADEYPFLIDETGFSVLPLTAATLNFKSSTERISTGIPALDEMMQGKGYFRGSMILVSGEAGTGKTSMACHFANAMCRRGERCLYIGFEESADQALQDAASVGIDLRPWLKTRVLVYQAWRPTQYGMEMHLLRIHRLVEALKPRCVIVDPISAFISRGSGPDVRSMLLRLIDFLKVREITAMFTAETKIDEPLECAHEQISSMVETWILLRGFEVSGERNRCLYILKSRGMAHSNQLREFLVTDKGIQLIPVYIGAGKVLTGSARLNQEAQDRAEALLRRQNIEWKQQELKAKRSELKRRIEGLREEYQVQERAIEASIQLAQGVQDRLRLEAAAMAASRQAGDQPGENRRPSNRAKK